MAQETDNLLRRWFEEVWNQGRIEAIDELAAPDVVAHGLTDSRGVQVTGREVFKEFWRGFRDAFPDVRITVEDDLMAGEKMMVRCSVTGTHHGPGLGVAPTGKRIEFTGMCMARAKDGQIVEAWNSFDFLSFYQQFGLLPERLAG